MLNYWEILNYKKHLKNYLDIFPKEQIMILSFEELKKHPEKVFQKVFKFLEVEKNFTPNLHLKNPGKKQIVKPIHLVLQNPLLKKIFQNILPISMRDSLFEFLTNNFSKKIPTKQKNSENLSRILKQSNQGKEMLQKYQEIKKLFD
jgi:hypothetical protein